jgi:tetratricopeptide (TPR) repeat protein
LVSNLASVLEDSARAVRIAAAARLAQLPVSTLTDSQRKAFEQALIEFRASQALSLDHAGGHLVLASFDRQHGRTEEAVQHLESAIKLEPYLSGPRTELASLMQELGGDRAEIRRLRTKEAELVERDSKLAPDNASIFYHLGLLRYTLDELDKAAAAFEAACAKAPRNYDYLMALALLQERRYVLTGDEKQFDAAVLSLKKLQEMNPADPRAKQISDRLMETRRTRHPDSP